MRSSSGERVRLRLAARPGSLILACSLGLAGMAAAAPQATTTRASVDAAGGQANAASTGPSVSSDGRYVAFVSWASNLVAGDTNGARDVFVKDRSTGAITRVSMASGGAQASGDSFAPSISADGRYVAFVSTASNLVAGDTNGARDVFLRDTQAGATSRISVATSGVQGDAGSWGPSMSGDGQHVAFASNASNLVGGSYVPSQVFVHHPSSGITKAVSLNDGGVPANGPSESPSISTDG